MQIRDLVTPAPGIVERLIQNLSRAEAAIDDCRQTLAIDLRFDERFCTGQNLGLRQPVRRFERGPKVSVLGAIGRESKWGETGAAVCQNKLCNALSQANSRP